MERTISRNPSTAEVRLHCLDMAVRAAQLMGRGDAILTVGEQYYEWVMKGNQLSISMQILPPTPAPEAPADGQGGGGPETVDTTDQNATDTTAGPPGPPSVRQGRRTT